jgi:acetate kinase
MKILVLNSGSSSQKASLYQIGQIPLEAPPAPLWEGRIEWRNHSATISVKNHQGAAHKEELFDSSREEAVRHLLGTAWSGKTRAIDFASEIDAVGHRVVHGGPHFEEPAILTPEVRAVIDGVSAFAPLHIRAELEGMEIIENLLGAVEQKHARWRGSERWPKSMPTWSNGTMVSTKGERRLRFKRNGRTGICSETGAPEANRQRRSASGLSGWCSGSVR